MNFDAALMRRAIVLAARAEGETMPNPIVGAVIATPNGQIIGEGYHHRAGMPHAEIEALRVAGEAACGGILAVTLEPCSSSGRTGPCTEAIIKSGIKRVLIGCLDPNPKHAGRGVEILRRAGVEVVVPVEEERCCKLNRDFFEWVVNHRPWTILKMAQTLDGKIASSSGVSKWITGSVARKRVQALRRRCGAIMVSSRTAKFDHPELRVREPEKWWRQPTIVIACAKSDPAEIRSLFPPDREVWCEKLDTAEDWRNLERRLADAGVMSLLIEGGGELAASALRNNAVDEVEFHYAPMLLGGRNSRTSVAGEDVMDLSAAIQLEEVEIKHLGKDFAVTGLVKKINTNC